MRPLPRGMPSSQHEEIPSNVSFMRKVSLADLLI